jgi:hypothetical protein
VKLKSGKLTYSENGSPTLVVQGIGDNGIPSVSVVEVNKIGSDKDRDGFNNIMEAARQKLIDEHGE